MESTATKIVLAFADAKDRESIYSIRHQVYASELSQHPENESGRLMDKLDAINCYIVAKIDDEIAGFVAITPPNNVGYSIDKYFSREDLPLVFDEGLYEIRLLTVIDAKRGSHVCAMLVFGALSYIDSLKGKTIVAIGRLEVLDIYLQGGMQSLGRQVQSGKVSYELLSAETRDLRSFLRLKKLFAHLEKRVDWKLTGVNFLKPVSCYHGGDFFDAIGDEFDSLHKINDVINADVLDAWFDPVPGILKALEKHLAWALKTSPPTGSEGMQRMIATARGVQTKNILPGAGSSDLIFLGLRHWITPASRVLILDPMYGEYAHVLENVIGCQVSRFLLSRENNYAVDLNKLASCLKSDYDWVILVNPNSPTGQYIEKENLRNIIKAVPKTTRFWIDETYIDYVDSAQSLEQSAADSSNVVICKSMSKAYALSGVRSAYLCGPEVLIDELRLISPPWAVSLPGQIVACEALRNSVYYRERWEETHRLRDDLTLGLSGLGWDVVPGHANFLLCHIPLDQPETAVVISGCRKHKLFLRDVANMGHCFDNRTIRIAVKDAKINQAMLEIIKMVLRN